MILFGEKPKKGANAKIHFIDTNTVFETPFWLIVVGNLSHYGGSVKLALKAKPNDGKLDIAIFPYGDTIDTAKLLIEALTESHLEDGEVSYFTSTEFEITTDPPVYCQIDGELLGKTPVHYKIKPLALKVKM
jgi:diacylglycerol kinase (ATP)